MKSKNKSVARRRALVASLVAGGSALVPATANAGIISITENQTIGFGAGELSTFSVTGLPGASFKISTLVPNTVTREIPIVQTAGSVTFRGAVSRPHFLVAEGSGKTYGQFGQPASKFSLEGCVANIFGFAGCTTNGESGSYVSFRFKDTNRAGAFDYGYLTRSYTENYAGLAFTLNTVVYDNTGARIKTGDLPPAPAPEPVSLALSALVLGAVGMRQWKSRRNQPAV